MAKTKTAKATKAKTPKAKKPTSVTAPAATDTKILTVKFNKDEAVFEAYDSKGKLYTAEDCPRQIMLQLALKAKQELYFAGKKWRRRTPESASTPVVSATPIKATATAVATK